MVVMGHIGVPFGVRGWVKVQTYSERVDSLLDHPVWWMARRDSQDWREVEVLETRVLGKGLAVRLAGCDDRDVAASWRGWQIAVPREKLPAAGKDEYYWADLIGLEVRTVEGAVLGRVESLLETGAHDVLVVAGERERLIPFVPAHVLEVDVGGGWLRVDWPADF